MNIILCVIHILYYKQFVWQFFIINLERTYCLSFCSNVFLFDNITIRLILYNNPLQFTIKYVST